MSVNAAKHQKSHISFIGMYFGAVFLRQCMCVWKIHVENLIFATNLQWNIIKTNQGNKMMK